MAHIENVVLPKNIECFLFISKGHIDSLVTEIKDLYYNLHDIYLYRYIYYINMIEAYTYTALLDFDINYLFSILYSTLFRY